MTINQGHASLKFSWVASATWERVCGLKLSPGSRFRNRERACEKNKIAKSAGGARGAAVATSSTTIHQSHVDIGSAQQFALNENHLLARALDSLSIFFYFAKISNCGGNILLWKRRAQRCGRGPPGALGGWSAGLNGVERSKGAWADPGTRRRRRCSRPPTLLGRLTSAPQRQPFTVVAGSAKRVQFACSQRRSRISTPSLLNGLAAIFHTPNATLDHTHPPVSCIIPLAP